MPLNQLFIGFIAIVTIIRLGLIVTGPMDAREKAAKMGWWIMGLVAIVTSWIALGQFFGVHTNGFRKPGQTGTVTPVEESYKTGLDDDEKASNSNTYYGTGYQEQTSSGTITVNPVDKP